MKIIKQLQKVLTVALPTFLILGILDYRFHNYYWPSLDSFRLYHGAMFDFFSIFKIFTIIFALNTLLIILKNPKTYFKHFLKLKNISLLLLLIAIPITLLTYQGIEPIIKTVEDQILTNYLIPISIFAALSISFTEKNNLKLFKKSLLINFSIFATVILIQYFSHIFPGDTKDYLGRLVWPYIDPFFEPKAESANWLAYLFGPIALLSTLEIKNKWTIIPLLLSLSIVFLSQSYTSIIILGALIFVYLFQQSNKKQKIILGSLAIISALTIIITQYNTPKFQILIGKYDHGRPNSIERRIQIYQVSEHLLQEQPFTGLGPGNYQSLFKQKMNTILDQPIPQEEIPPHPHNLALNFYSDLGLIGFISILLLYLQTAWQTLIKHNKHYFLLAYPLGHGLVDTPYGLEEASTIFFILLAVAVHYHSQKNNLRQSH